MMSIEQRIATVLSVAFPFTCSIFTPVCVLLMANGINMDGLGYNLSLLLLLFREQTLLSDTFCIRFYLIPASADEAVHYSSAIYNALSFPFAFTRVLCFLFGVCMPEAGIWNAHLFRTLFQFASPTAEGRGELVSYNFGICFICSSLFSLCATFGGHSVRYVQIDPTKVGDGIGRQYYIKSSHMNALSLIPLHPNRLVIFDELQTPIRAHMSMFYSRMHGHQPQHAGTHIVTSCYRNPSVDCRAGRHLSDVSAEAYLIRLYPGRPCGICTNAYQIALFTLRSNPIVENYLKCLHPLILPTYQREYPTSFILPTQDLSNFMKHVFSRCKSQTVTFRISQPCIH
jgi:hypothetical protein